MLAVASVITAGLLLAPGTSSATANGVLAVGHVNSNVVYTYIYDASSGANAVGVLYTCDTFNYYEERNGRRHLNGGGWVSMDKTSGGTC